MEYILEVTNLKKEFKDFAIKDITFSLQKGYIMGFIGPNGAGKSSTIKLIMNLLKKDAGEIKVFNSTDIIIVFASLGLLAAFYYPLYFKFGYNFSRKVNIVLFMLIFFGPGSFVSFMKNSGNPPPQAIMVILVLVIMLMLISLAASVKIYKNKEF